MTSRGKLRVGSMCTGYGGLDLAVSALYPTHLLWYAESDQHASALLRTRFPGVDNLGDLTLVDWTKVPAVDMVTAGWPCQDISYAGRGAGIKKGTRSGLWLVIAEALRLLRPPLVLLENVAALRTRGLEKVLGDLAALGYDTAWLCLRASDVGAPHRRERLFLLAHLPPAHSAVRNPLPAAPDGTPGGRSSGVVGRCGLLQPAPHSHRVQCQWRRVGAVVDGAAQAATPAAADAASDRGAAATNTQSQRHRNTRSPRRGGLRPAAVGRPAPDTESKRCDQRQPKPARLTRRSDPDISDPPDWGPYQAAISRWEAVLGRPAPHPTEPGQHGQPRLSARLVEWMMGLPEGWVTDIDLPRTAHMRILGNGVVPQQAAEALHHLIHLAATERP